MCWVTMKRRSSELLRVWKSGCVQIEGWSQLGGRCGKKYSVFPVVTVMAFGGRARGLAMEAGTRVQKQWRTKSCGAGVSLENVKP